ncbi:MAG: hypothetical protein R6V57_03620 [Vicinamibacterales bacterium]
MHSTRALAGLIAGATACWLALGAGSGADGPPLPNDHQDARDAFAFVRALDEAASRAVWPGFDSSAIPVALFDGERTVLLRHPSPPPEFSPMPGRPGVLVARGRHPAVTSNSTREIGGVRTATVIATPAEPVERTMLAVVEEVFHVFWLARHPAFRPDELARYAYPLEDADNLRALLVEDEALARALESRSTTDTARWVAAALAVRRARVPALAADVRAWETSLEMMEGSANYAARVAVGEPVQKTADRLRAPRPADGIRWRFYDTGAALCFALDRVSPGWKERGERTPDLTTVEQLDESLRASGAEPAVLEAAASARILARVSADIADLGRRREEVRAGLLGRPGRRIVIEVDDGAEPLRIRRFDPINLMVLAGGEVAHPNYLALESAQGSVELNNSAFVRGTFGGTVGLSAPAGRHPLSGGIRRLTIAGIAASPEVGGDASTVTVEAPGVRISLRHAQARAEGELLRITIKGSRP